MIPFKNISVADRQTIIQYTAKSNRRNCDLSFSNLCSWSFYYHTQYAIWKDFLIFKFWVENDLAYMMPVGNGDLKTTLKDMIEDAKEEGHPFCMLGVCSDMRSDLEEINQNDFNFTYDRDYDDYIYLRTDLATLVGKKFQSKRNFVNRFKKTYNYKYSDITDAYIDECIALEAKWYSENNDKKDEGTGHERQAVIFALKHFEELGLSGGILHVDDKIAAFTFGMPINKDTFGVHVEKADTNIKGSYAMINYEFANHIPEQYVYVNREEDLGEEGLRKAKLSYNPTILLQKYMACLKEKPINEMIKW